MTAALSEGLLPLYSGSLTMRRSAPLTPSRGIMPSDFPPYSQRITEAATWTLVADLVRRHEAAQGLRVIETHPGGGQYDCRTLLRPVTGDYGVLLHLNLASGNATATRPLSKPAKLPELAWAEDDDRIAYVAAVLQTEDRRAVRHWLEARLGLPRVAQAPDWSRHSLTYGIMAGVAARHAFLGPRIRWVNAFIDTSGYGPDDPVRPEVHAVPALEAQLRDIQALPTPAHHPAYGMWLLTVADKTESSFVPMAVLCVDARFYELAQPNTTYDLSGEYHGYGRLAPVIDFVAARVALV